MTQSDIKDYILAALAVLALAAFMWLFGRDLWSAFRRRAPAPDPPAAELENPRLYVATAVAGLVGAVSAVFLGVEAVTQRLAGGEWQAADYVRVAYVIIYILFGAAAIVAWVQRKGETPVTLRNLAVTFIGIATPAIGGWLGVKAGLL